MPRPSAHAAKTNTKTTTETMAENSPPPARAAVTVVRSYISQKHFITVHQEDPLRRCAAALSKVGLLNRLINELAHVRRADLNKLKRLEFV